MKLLTCEYKGGVHLGVVCGDGSVYLPALDARWRERGLPLDMLALIDAGEPALDALRERLAHLARGGAQGVQGALMGARGQRERQ